MDTLHNIFTRSSIRRFADRPIPEEVLHEILRAGMSGPTCVNARDWAFVLTTDKQKLTQMADANGSPAAPLKRAAAGILICGDLERAFQPAPDYWVVDGAIAGENMLLAARSLGVEGVWLGTWPQMDRVHRQAALFGLPDTVVPHSVLALGYPAEAPSDEERNLYEEDRVHMGKW